MDNENDELTLRAIIIAGIKKFAGEIIGVILLGCFLWAFPGFRSLFTDHTFPAVKDESHEEMQREPDIHEQEEAHQSEIKSSLKIRAVNNVWLNVSLGNAEPVYRKTLRRGEVMQWNLTEPARVTFGRPASARVILNGKDLGIVNPSAKRAETYIYAPNGTYIKAETSQTPDNSKAPSMNDNDFMKLCRSGRAEKVEEAVTKGADVNAKDNKGRTVLMQAAQNGHTRTAEVLLKHGANVNAKDNDGYTALMRAVFSGRTRTAEVLLKHGADVNAKDNSGWTALRWSVRHKDTAALLRRYGAKE